MQCDTCRKRAVIFQRYSGRHLCREHFLRDFEGRAKKIVRFNGGFSRGDHIAIACPGDHRGFSLLNFLATLTAGRRGIMLSIIPPENCSYGSGLTAPEPAAATLLGIPALEGLVTDRHGHIGCPKQGKGGVAATENESSCEPLPERRLQAEGITVVATAVSLDDEAATILAAFLEGEPFRFLSPQGPAGSGIRFIRPFLHIPGREVALYARLGFGLKGASQNVYAEDPVSMEIRDLLDRYSSKHPSAPFSLVNLGERLHGAETGTGTGDAPARDRGEGAPAKRHYRKGQTNHR